MARAFRFAVLVAGLAVGGFSLAVARDGAGNSFGGGSAFAGAAELAAGYALLAVGFAAWLRPQAGQADKARNGIPEFQSRHQCRQPERSEGNENSRGSEPSAGSSAAQPSSPTAWPFTLASAGPAAAGQPVTLNATA
jgi:hypothetical protein